jgi:hypothetical protein
MSRRPARLRFVARINAGIAAGGATGDWLVWDLAARGTGRS